MTSVKMAASAPTAAVTFSVNPAAKCCIEALPRGTMKEHIESRLGYNVEACYNQSDPVVHSPPPPLPKGFIFCGPLGRK